LAEADRGGQLDERAPDRSGEAHAGLWIAPRGAHCRLAEPAAHRPARDRARAEHAHADAAARAGVAQPARGPALSSAARSSGRRAARSSRRTRGARALPRAQTRARRMAVDGSDGLSEPERAPLLERDGRAGCRNELYGGRGWLFMTYQYYVMNAAVSSASCSHRRRPEAVTVAAAASSRARGGGDALHLSCCVGAYSSA
jgi:hypothetical protein